MEKPALKVEDISIRFNLSKEKVDNLKELLIKKIKGRDKFVLTNSGLLKILILNFKKVTDLESLVLTEQASLHFLKLLQEFTNLQQVRLQETVI